MSKEPPQEILGSLPRTRPHRRSDKRRTASETALSDAASADSKPAPSKAPKRRAPAAEKTSKRGEGAKPRRAAPRTHTLRQPKQPGGTPPRPGTRTPTAPGRVAAPPTRRGDVVSTMVHAAAELTEIGLSLSARAVRGALGRLPRP